MMAVVVTDRSHSSVLIDHYLSSTTIVIGMATSILTTAAGEFNRNDRVTFDTREREKDILGEIQGVVGGTEKEGDSDGEARSTSSSHLFQSEITLESALSLRIPQQGSCTQQPRLQWYVHVSPIVPTLGIPSMSKEKTRKL